MYYTQRILSKRCWQEMRVVRLLLQSMLHNEKTFLRFSVKKIQAQNFWWSLRTVLPWPIFSFTNFFLLYPTDPMHYYMFLVSSLQYKSQFHVGREEEGSSWVFWLCFLSGFYAACALAWAIFRLAKQRMNSQETGTQQDPAVFISHPGDMSSQFFVSYKFI